MMNLTGFDRRNLPDGLSAFDLLKTLALLLMVVDHVGYYFLPGDLIGTIGHPDMWWRVIGRWCVPIWFFLVGYSRSRDVSVWIWAAAAIITLHNVSIGLYVFALNNLVTIILVRLMLDPVARFALRNIFTLGAVVIVCLALFPMTDRVTEYGTLGLLIALVGYVARHGQEVGASAMVRAKHFLPAFAAGAAVLAAACQTTVFVTFDPIQTQLMFAGMMATMMLCVYIPKTSFPYLELVIPGGVVRLLKFTGRHTMFLYVAHLIVFKAAAMYFGLGHPIYGWFDWEWDMFETYGKLVRPGMMP